MVCSPIYKLINLSQETFLNTLKILQSVFWGLKVTDHILLSLHAWQMSESLHHHPHSPGLFVCLHLYSALGSGDSEKMWRGYS